MKLSILDSLEVARGSTSAAALQAAIGLAKLGDELGLERYWVVEHHGFGHELCPAPDILLGAVASATRRIRVGAGGMLLNRHSPYRIAQAFRTLMALHPDRIDLGIGRSMAGINAERVFRRDAGEVTPEEHPARVEEVLGWLSNSIAQDGPLAGLHILPDLAAGPTPWLLAASPGTGALAARLGLPLAFSGFIRPDLVAEVSAGYRAQFQPSAYAAGLKAPRSLVAVMAVAAETQEEAEHLALPLRMVLDLRVKQRIVLPEMPSFEDAIAHFGGMVPSSPDDRPSRLVGTYADIAQKLRAIGKAAGVDEIMIRPFTTDIGARHAMFRELAPLLKD